MVEQSDSKREPDALPAAEDPVTSSKINQQPSKPNSRPRKPRDSSMDGAHSVKHKQRRTMLRDTVQYLGEGRPKKIHKTRKPATGVLQDDELIIISSLSPKPKRGRGRRRSRKIRNSEPTVGDLQDDVASKQSSKPKIGSMIETSDSKREPGDLQATVDNVTTSEAIECPALSKEDIVISSEINIEPTTGDLQGDVTSSKQCSEPNNGKSRPRKALINREPTTGDIHDQDDELIIISSISSEPKSGRGQPRKTRKISKPITADLEVSQNPAKSQTQFQTEYELLLDSETESETSKQKSSRFMDNVENRTTEPIAACNLHDNQLTSEQSSKSKSGRGRPRKTHNHINEPTMGDIHDQNDELIIISGLSSKPKRGRGRGRPSRKTRNSSKDSAHSVKHKQRRPMLRDTVQCLGKGAVNELDFILQSIKRQQQRQQVTTRTARMSITQKRTVTPNVTGE